MVRCGDSYDFGPTKRVRLRYEDDVVLASCSGPWQRLKALAVVFSDIARTSYFNCRSKEACIEENGICIAKAVRAHADAKARVV